MLTLSRPTKASLTAYAIAVAVLVADQASKAWILNDFDLPRKSPVEVLPILKLSMVWNRGVSFGLMSAHDSLGRWLLVAFAAAITVALAAWAWRMNRWMTAVAVGLVMGGALGNNVIDRVRWGAVADFLDFSAIGFPWVFNIADSCISVGVALLLLDSLMTPSPAKAPRV
jgi:signal peptidase II